jgi:hypothetical protein
MTIHHKRNDRKAKFFSQKALKELSQKVLKNISKTLNKNEINEIARASKFIKRSSSKITGYEFLTSILISCNDPEEATLEKISDLFRSRFRVRIRAQSIMERINSSSAACFFKNVFEKLLKNQFDSFAGNVPSNLLSFFSKILIQDSSSCDLNQKLSPIFRGSGGRASKSSLKLDVIYDFKAKRFEHITLNEGSVADQKLANKIIEYITCNSLIIRDLGYLRIDCILKIVEAKAFFLSRMKNNMCVYLNDKDTEQLDFAKYLHENFRKANVVDVKVYITASKVAVRLIAYRVPQEIAAQRRRTAHAKAKKEGRTLTQKSLTLLDFSLFITNVSAEIWPAEVVGTIYRIRWQIELMFKDWKGRLKIDCLLGINHFRIESLIYSRMIFILIINEVYKLLDYVGRHVDTVVSMHKVYSWLKCTGRLLRVLSGKFSWWEERYLDDLILTSMSHQKRKRKTSLQSICEYDFYYSEAS